MQRAFVPTGHMKGTQADTVVTQLYSDYPNDSTSTQIHHMQSFPLDKIISSKERLTGVEKAECANFGLCSLLLLRHRGLGLVISLSHKLFNTHQIYAGRQHYWHCTVAQIHGFLWKLFFIFFFDENKSSESSCCCLPRTWTRHYMGTQIENIQSPVTMCSSIPSTSLPL